MPPATVLVPTPYDALFHDLAARSALTRHLLQAVIIEQSMLTQAADGALLGLDRVDAQLRLSTVEDRVARAETDGRQATAAVSALLALLATVPEGTALARAFRAHLAVEAHKLDLPPLAAHLR